ncbi:MAG: hypothetical protein KGJ82_18925 [Nitrospirota bacterium]|nr:hypothetical protein [Nitrospirota bacterium]
MEQSKADFKQCLSQHSQEANQCAALRRVYEADLAAHRATSSGIRPGSVVDVQESK